MDINIANIVVNALLTFVVALVGIFLTYQLLQEKQ